MLNAIDVRYSFGQTVALADASATVAPGEKVALVGPSGSGKTTFLYCLAGLLRPGRGQVLFNGKDLAKMSDEERSDLRLRSFGFVFQFAELVPELTIRENVALPLDLAGVDRAERAERVALLLDRLGLTSEAGRRPAQVSGGQAQRAAVARAIVHRPSVVFADEPTGSLDTANGEAVIDLLFGLSEEQGSAVVLVTHDPKIACRADRVLELRDGRLLAEVPSP
ncbi:ABC transporter ATP-binding protein [Micromonospora olivasterospora]|uniref:Putative ABC transport system ATP-binding protein n=2 Tax=Micromonospora olivasterospora TaxID=1880 RepID=A0A562IFY1_MICOL|nr:ABC transporter ATP-binding protein [Micromonospora olivasterospora]TWH69635.1 putative ABC transport system ATP-binding protein [Micromonospora olivasterospora]